MCIFLGSHRQGAHGSEHRLLAQHAGTAGPEVPTEQPVVAPAETPHQAARELLEQLAREIQRQKLQGKEKVSFFKNHVLQLTEGKINDVSIILHDQVAVPEIFTDVFKIGTPEYQEVLDATRDKLQFLKSSMKELTHTSGQMAMDFAEGVTNFVLPKRITESMTPLQKRTFGGALTVGTALLAGWVAYGLVKASKGVREAGRKVRNTFLWFLGGAAVIGGTYIGFQAWQNWGEIKKQMAGLQSKLELTAKATGEAKDKLMKEAEEMRNKIEEIRQKAVAAVSVPEKKDEPAVSAATPAIEDVSAAPASPLVKLTPENVGQIEKELDEGLERKALEWTGSGLLLMFANRAEESGIEEAAEQNAVRVLLNNPDIQTLKLQKLSTIQSQADTLNFLGPDAPSAKQKALLFLAKISCDLSATAQETTDKKQIEQWTLKDLIDQVHYAPRAFARLQNALKGKNWKDVGDIATVLTSVFSEEGLNDLENDMTVRKELEMLGVKGHERLFFAQCLVHGNSKLISEIDVEANQPEAMQAVQKALIAISGKLQSAEVANYLEKYLHNRTDLPFAAKLREQLLQNLTVMDAVQLYMYLKLAEKNGALPQDTASSPPIGALMLQMKVIDLLGKSDHALADHLKVDLTDDLLSNPSSLQLPEGTREFLTMLITKGGSVAVDFGQDYVQDLYERSLIVLYEMQRKHPTMTASVGGVSTTLPIMWGMIEGLQYWKLGSSGRMTNKLVLTGVTRYMPHHWINRLRGVWNEPLRLAWDPGSALTLGTDIKNIELSLLQKGVDPKLNVAYNSLHYRGYSPESFQQFYRELAALKKQGSDPAAIKALAQQVRGAIEPHALTLQYRRFNYFQRQWYNAVPWQRAAWVGGVAAQGYMVYQDIVDIGEKWEDEKKMQNRINDLKKDICGEIIRGGNFEAVAGQQDTYRHKVSGVEISLKQVTQQLKQGSEPLDMRTYAQYGRAAISTASLVGTLIMGAKVFSGPGGLAIAAIEITVRTGINAWEQGKMREFIKDAPPWVLTLLGTEQTTGASEADWLTNASGWMMSDIWKESSDKAGIREKMLFTIFNHDLRTYAPELFADITQGLDEPPLLDGLFENDFKTVILPAFCIRLFELAGSDSVSWKNFSQGKVDSGLMIIPPDVTLVQIRTAMRDASVLYAQHLREARYLELIRAREEAAASEDGIDPVLEGVIAAAGEEIALGSKLSDLTPQIIAQNGGKTRTELLIETLTKQLTNAPGDARGDKLAKRSNIFTVAPGTIAGLNNAFDAGNSRTIIDLIPDPVLREQLSRIIPETTEEKEGAANTSWKEWYKGESWKEWVQPATAYDRGTGADMATMAANFLQNELHAPSLAGNTSLEAAARAITLGGVELMAKNRMKGPLQHDEKLAGTIYGQSLHRPIVFSRLQGKTDEHVQRQVDLCRQLSIPNTSQKEFDFEHVAAVFFEGMTMKESGHNVVLATFVYVDPEDTSQQPNFLTVQQAAATSATRLGTTMTGGLALASNPTEFFAQAETQTMLGQTITGMRAQQKDLEQASKRTEEVNIEVKTEWERTKPDRDAAEKSQNTLRDAALTCTSVPGTIVYVPGAYERDESKRIFRLQEGNFAGTIDGTFVSFASPSSSGTPSMSAVPAAGSALLRPAEKDRFRYTMNKDGQSRENIVADLAAAANGPASTRTLLTTPLNLSGHPQAQDSRFIEQVQRHELERLLNLATYTKSLMWGAEEYKKNLSTELWPFYRDAQNKQIFLNTLMNNLLTEKEISSGAYKRILRNMRQQY